MPSTAVARRAPQPHPRRSRRPLCRRRAAARCAARAATCSTAAAATPPSAPITSHADRHSSRSSHRHRSQRRRSVRIEHGADVEHARALRKRISGATPMPVRSPDLVRHPARDVGVERLAAAAGTISAQTSPPTSMSRPRRRHHLAARRGFERQAMAQLADVAALIGAPSCRAQQLRRMPAARGRA